MFIEEFDRVMGGEVIRHPCHGGRGGEWDALRALPRSTLRTLTGARLLTPTGLEPDVATTLVIAPKLGLEDVCSAMAWYAGMALMVVGERRQEAYRRRHQRLAARHGHRTYFAYRNSLSVEAGWRSYWAERKVRWPSVVSPVPVVAFNDYLRQLEEAGASAAKGRQRRGHRADT